jgi:hypothetical protein
LAGRRRIKGIRQRSEEERGGVVMALTMWSNTITGERLDDRQLEQYQERAHRLYEANQHIFEDELDALAALGVLPPLSTAA